MINSVRVSQRVIKARVTSGARKTFVSIKSGGNRVKAMFVGTQGPAGADGEKFFPTTATRYTNFVGDGVAETIISEVRIFLPLIPVAGRTFERGMVGWWNPTDSRIEPETIGDAFRLRLTLLARPVNPVSIPVLIVEINNAADIEPPRIIAVEKQPITSGAFEELSFNFEAFAGANVFLNGGLITLRTFGGSAVIKDPRLLVKEG